MSEHVRLEQKSSGTTLELAAYHWRFDVNAENMSAPGTLGYSLQAVGQHIPRSTQLWYTIYPPDCDIRDNLLSVTKPLSAVSTR